MYIYIYIYVYYRSTNNSSIPNNHTRNGPSPPQVRNSEKCQPTSKRVEKIIHFLTYQATCSTWLFPEIWVAVKELRFKYHNPETMSVTIYPYYVNLKMKFLSPEIWGPIFAVPVLRITTYCIYFGAPYLWKPPLGERP